MTDKLQDALSFLDQLCKMKVQLIDDQSVYLTSIEVTNWCEVSLFKRYPLEVKVEFTQYCIYDDRYETPELKRGDTRSLSLTGHPIILKDTLVKIITTEEYK